MKKPTPENFDLTPQRIEEIERALEQFEKAVLWVLGPAGVYLGIASGVLERSIAIGVLYAFVLVLPGLFASVVVGSVGRAILTRVLYGNYRTWLQAKDIYEAWFRRTQVEFWMSLSGRGFEHEVAALLDKAGLGARVTSASGDEGVDVILRDGTLVQCKAHKARVSPGPARELYGTLQHFKAPKAILVSRSGFTSGVQEFVRDKPIQLWELGNLITLQKRLAEP